MNKEELAKQYSLRFYNSEDEFYKLHIEHAQEDFIAGYEACEERMKKLLTLLDKARWTVRDRRKLGQEREEEFNLEIEIAATLGKFDYESPGYQTSNFKTNEEIPIGFAEWLSDKRYVFDEKWYKFKPGTFEIDISKTYNPQDLFQLYLKEKDIKL